MFNVGYILSRVGVKSCNIDPDHTALVFQDRRLSYRELNWRTNRIANKFKELGIRKGDRVAALLHNCAEYWEVFFACAKLGLILVPVNFRLAMPELEFIVNDCSPCVLIFDGLFQQNIQTFETKSSSVEYYVRLLINEERELAFSEDAHHLTYDSLYNAPESEVDEDVDLNDDLFIMYTSGTTGRPKGAVWTHGNSQWFAVSQIITSGYASEDVSLIFLPMYHVGALQDLSQPTFYQGGTVVMFPSGGFDLNKFLQTIALEKVTTTLMVPTIARDFIHMPEKDVKSYDLRTLRRVFVGAEALSIPDIQCFMERLPGAELGYCWGLTEGPPIATLCWGKDNISKAGSVGKPISGTMVKAVDKNGNRVGAGEVGELLLLAPMVSKGYWKLPKETEETFTRGWCRTGDLGYIDEDGFVYIRGRKKDMIISGGENIYPAEVERMLSEHPKIRAVAVIGIPDAHWGEAVMAIVVPKEGEILTEEEIIGFSKQRIAGYKRPRHVLFVDELPYTSTGKVKKHILRDLAKTK